MKKLTKTRATTIGAIGGKATLKRRGKKHFAKISMMRKSFKGGRPRKAKEGESNV